MALGALVLAGPAAAADAVRCSADLLCVEVHGDEQIELVLDTRARKPLSFRLFLTDNLTGAEQPAVRLDGPGRQTLVSFRRPAGPWGFEYRVHYGHTAHAHDESAVYELPFAPGAGYLVAQAHTNVTTHRLGNRHALDFAMPVGQPVHAARGGEVVSVYAGSTRGDTSGSATANHIWIRHPDGTIGKYLHLDCDGVLVAEGDRVAAGARIGTSGNTGFSRGAHLHFSVSSLGGPALYRTFNVPFTTEQGSTTLVGGERYRRPL